MASGFGSTKPDQANNPKRQVDMQGWRQASSQEIAAGIHPSEGFWSKEEADEPGGAGTVWTNKPVGWNLGRY